ncbi:aminotransferase class V-fold PLP-dependent enzyme [Peptostreptococcus anaerobius]|uniref:Aminotransferase class V-fold PLP-dependent enzyme n=1 Tax=Peptostreptococcus porci TaxID=2652282 RepID=A0A6N7X4X4_9FIRM|nr:aminotransferase class V-fold PLP-dependent enzyme [Peptostreptococcus porci]MST63111.1 aminotransferase class V-fold PLP-dependent enzyme [Peptostreptococcus porci]
MEFAASFSGGKDSILAIKKMLDRGHRLVALIVSTVENEDVSWTHSIEKEYFIEVSKILKCDVLFTDSKIDNYELRFENSLRIAKKIGAQFCIFGDIDIEKHLKWNKDRCDNAGLECIHPLLFANRLDILNDFFNTRFLARITKVNTLKLDESFVGRLLTPQIIEEFSNYDIDYCGENGEYHTLIELNSIRSEFSDDKMIFDNGISLNNITASNSHDASSNHIFSEIYMDNASTCFPKAPGVASEMMKYIDNYSYSINRGTFIKSYELLGKVIDIREKIMNFFSISSEYECIFTPSATYSSNQILSGLIFDGDILITGQSNHNSASRIIYNLKNKGAVIKQLSSKEIYDYICDEHTFGNGKAKAIYITVTNNVTGEMFMEIDKLKKLSKKCTEKNVILILDIVQSVCENIIDFSEIYADAFILSPHIGLMSSEGLGISILSKKIIGDIVPTVFGGTGSKSDSDEMPLSSPDKFEVGTLNIASIIGVSSAIDYIDFIGVKSIVEKKHLIGRYLRDELSKINGAMVKGEGSFCLLNIDGCDMSTISFFLDSDYGVQTRVGIHCSHETHRNIYTFPDGGVRFSVGFFNTKEEVDKVVDAVRYLVSQYRY